VLTIHQRLLQQQFKNGIADVSQESWLLETIVYYGQEYEFVYYYRLDDLNLQKMQHFSFSSV
jgi:hypothetical protein